MHSIQIAIWLCVWLTFTASTLHVYAVQCPPSLINGPRAKIKYLTSNPGDKVKLNCTAAGSPSLERQWFRNDQELYRTDEVLTIEGQNVDALEGYYQCHVSNTWGKIVSNKTLVLVAREASKHAYTHPFYYYANVGMNLTLPCKIEDHGFPPPTVDNIGWTQDDDDIDQTQRLHFTHTGELHFSAVRRNDFGKRFRCKIKNPYTYIDVKSSTDSIIRQDTNLPEQAPTSPRIMFYSNQSLNRDTQSAAVVVGIETRSVALRCIFAGSDDVEIDWRLRPGISVSRFTKDLQRSRLTLHDLRRSDEGQYVCVGVNHLGRTQFTFQLVIYAAPRFESVENQPHDINASVGDDVRVRCMAYANPSATVQWYQNGNVLDPDNPPSNKFRWSDDRLTMTVQDLCKYNCSSSTNDLMVIQCNASNQHGYAFTNGYINVFERTRFVSTPQDVAADFPRPVTFHAAAVSDADTPVTYSWYHDGHPLVSDDIKVYVDTHGNLTLFDTDAADLGQYTCVASNRVSTVNATARLYLPTPDQVKTTGFPLWWLPIVVTFLLIIVITIVLCVSYSAYRNKGEDYEVDETERNCGNDPERDLCNEDFQPFRRQDETSTQSLDRSVTGSSRNMFVEQPS